MSDRLILALLALTTLGAYLLGARRLGLDPRRLPGAFGRALETLGATLLFFAANFGLCVAVALGARRYTESFLSLHQLSEWIVLALSLVQALVFREWREGPGAS